MTTDSEKIPNRRKQSDPHLRRRQVEKEKEKWGKILVAALMLAQLFTAPVSAQRRAAASQTNLRQVQYDQLNDYANDVKRRRLGERFVVTSVPLIKEIKRADQPGLSHVTVNEVGGVSANFVTSLTLARALRPHLKWLT